MAQGTERGVREEEEPDLTADGVVTNHGGAAALTAQNRNQIGREEEPKGGKLTVYRGEERRREPP